jgi:deoxyribodipyrimidine photo-lyase
VTSATAAPALLWFRQDLRLSDNPALAAALEHRSPVIPVFIWAPEEEGPWPPGAASRWWLHQSLGSLSAELEKRGSRLIVRRGANGGHVEPPGGGIGRIGRSVESPL